MLLFCLVPFRSFQFSFVFVFWFLHVLFLNGFDRNIFVTKTKLDKYIYISIYMNAIICRQASAISYPQHSTTCMSIILYVLCIFIHIHTHIPTPSSFYLTHTVSQIFIHSFIQSFISIFYSCIEIFRIYGMKHLFINVY